MGGKIKEIGEKGGLWIGSVCGVVKEDGKLCVTDERGEKV